ncbi:MAG: hypothetical protein AB9M53_00760 [Leptothrix sp. (in: b-proteobacteria)]
MRTRHLTHIRPSLAAKILASEPVQVRVEPKHRQGPPSPYPDAVVLEVRRLSEQCRMTYDQITVHMAFLGIAVDKSSLRRWCEYTTRDHLVPDPCRTEPYLQPIVTKPPVQGVD